MAIQEMELDPNAAAYTDDQIVGKVNTATANITRADSVEVAAVLESATEKLMSDVEKTKLGGIAEGAEVNPADLAALDSTAATKLGTIEDSATADQTGTEIQTAIVGLADADRVLIKTDPQAGEFTVSTIQRKSTGTLGIKYDDVAK